MLTETNTADAAYYDIAADYPVLERTEELELARRYRDHRCPRAADRLTLSMMRFVISVARRYARPGVPQEDLVAQGVVGVLEAIERFDPERGLRLVTLASYWVRAEISTAVRSHRSVVGSAPLRPGMAHRIETERAAVESEVEGAEARHTLLAERLGVSAKRLHSLLARAEARDVSLDSSDAPDGLPLLERVPDAAVSPEEQVALARWHAPLEDSVNNALELLDERERFIAKVRLLACPDDELSLAEIGRRLSVTRERARQLETRAKNKLRRHLQTARPSLAIAA